MREHGYDPELLQAIEWGRSEYAPSIQAMVDRGYKEHLRFAVEDAANKLLNPYQPDLQKGERKLAELIAGYADPDLLRHAMQRHCPLIFSTN
jgi:hypothetical protein